MLLALRLGEPTSEQALISESVCITIVLYLTGQTLHDVTTLGKATGADGDRRGTKADNNWTHYSLVIVPPNKDLRSFPWRDSLTDCSHRPHGMEWYGMVPLLPPGPQSLRPSGGSWIGRQLSMLRLSPFRPRTTRMHVPISIIMQDNGMAIGMACRHGAPPSETNLCALSTARLPGRAQCSH
jgi:hypothetical protein